MTQQSYTPSADFQARLNRISSGETHVAEGLVHTPRRENPDVKLTGGLMENALYPLSLIGAFGLGVLAVFFSRFARVHLLGGTDPESDMMLAFMADGAMAMAIGFMFKQAFRLEGADWVGAQTFGVTVMIAAMHNLVHLFPYAFSLMFTPEWVELVIGYSEPRSLQIMGYMVPF